MEQNESAKLRPAKVTTAMWLFYLTLGMGLIRVAMEMPRVTRMTGGQTQLPAEATTVIMVISAVVSFGLVLFFVYMAGKRRNWARIALLVLFVIGLAPSVPQLLRSLETVPVSGAIGLAQVVLQAAALVLLFQRPSSDWFRQPQV